MPAAPRGRGGLQHVGLELQAVLAVGEPDPGGGDPLARADGWRMSDKGDEVALASCLDLQDGKAVFGVVEGDPLHRARQRLFGRTCGGVRSADGSDGHGNQAGTGTARERIGCHKLRREGQLTCGGSEAQGQPLRGT